MPHGNALVMGDFMKCGNQHDGSGSQKNRLIRIRETGLFAVFKNADQAVARKSALPFSGIVSVKEIAEMQTQLIAERTDPVFFKMRELHTFHSFLHRGFQNFSYYTLRHFRNQGNSPFEFKKEKISHRKLFLKKMLFHILTFPESGV